MYLSFLSSTFSNTFYQPEPPVKESDLSPENNPSQHNTNVYYTEKKYGTIDEFGRHPDFGIFRKEFEETIDRIKQFVDTQHMAGHMTLDEKEKNTQAFDSLTKTLFRRDIGDKPLAMLCEYGKQSLDIFSALLDKEEILLDTKINAMKNLIAGTQECINGTVINLVMAARDLQLTAGGIFSQAWKAKEEIINDTVARFVVSISIRTVSEIHNATAYKNALASVFGIRVQTDSFAEQVTLNCWDLWKCKRQIDAALTPRGIAEIMARDCLVDVKNMMSDMFPGMSSIPAEQLQRKENHEALGTFLDSLKPKYGEIRVDKVLTADADGENYFLTKDSTMLVIDILHALRDNGLLARNCRSAQVIGWKVGESKAGELQAGIWRWKGESLVWYQCEEGRLPLEPKHLAKVQPNHIGDSSLRQEMARQVIRHTPADQLRQLAPQWLAFADLNEFFRGLSSPEAGLKYVRDNMQWFERSASPQQRIEVADMIVNARCDDLFPLLCHWKLLERTDNNGCTPLLQSASKGDTGMVSMLLKAGANPDAQDRDGSTALILAVKNEDYYTAGALLLAGARTDILDKNRMSANTYREATKQERLRQTER